MSNNQDPNQHIMYPQQSYQSYPAGAPAAAPNTMGTWGQPQPQQAVPYAFPYQPAPDMGSYNDKSGYGGAYPVPYGGGDADYYRSQNYYNSPQAHSNQWAQGGYPGYSNQPMYGTYQDRDQGRSGAFPGAPLPNMSRPPPNIKNENTFHTSLSLLENPAQSAAAYTASWVSSTSSIPPELKDEPEVFGGLDPVFNPHNLTDQFAGMQLTEAQKEAGRMQQQQQKQGDRRPREEPKELTWEERLRKAQVQKERVEQRGGGGGAVVEREPKPEREVGTSRGGGRSRGGPLGPGGPRRGDNHRQQRQHHQQQPNNATQPVNNHMMWKNSDSAEQQRMGGEHEGNHPPRPNYNRQSASMPPQMGGGPASPMQQQQQAHIAAANMPVYNQAQAQMMMRNRNPGYNFHRPMNQPQMNMMNMQQDERFKNTWLDATAFVHPFPLPFPPVTYGVDGNRGGRGRGRGGGGGRGMNRGGYNRREYRRGERGDDQSPEEKVSSTNNNNHHSDCVQPLPPPEEPTSFDSQP